MSVAHFPPASFIPQYVFPAVGSQGKVCECFNGTPCVLFWPQAEAWASSVIIHHLLASAFCKCERWRDLWSKWFSSWIFLCEYRCGNPLQVGEWKCQCVIIWTYIYGSTSQMPCSVESHITSSTSLSAFCNQYRFPSYFSIWKWWTGRDRVGSLKATMYKGENHVLVYFLWFQNPIKDSDFVDELKFLGSKQQGIFAWTSAF